jgi:hypothetical protein
VFLCGALKSQSGKPGPGSHSVMYPTRAEKGKNVHAGRDGSGDLVGAAWESKKDKARIFLKALERLLSAVRLGLPNYGSSFAMIVYLQSDFFPVSPLPPAPPPALTGQGRTFVVLAQRGDLVAHVRAGFLHILHDLNRLNVAFRFQHRGRLWKDSQLIQVDDT